jgi:hypothetical protein
MAAVLGNTPLTQVHLNHQVTLAQQRKLQEKMDAAERRREFREATKDLCEAVITAAMEINASDPETLREFHLFPKLPAELRLKICKFFQCNPAHILPVYGDGYLALFLHEAAVHSEWFNRSSRLIFI